MLYDVFCQPPLRTTNVRTRIVTIGPAFLLGFLGITFFIGSRNARSTRCNASNGVGVGPSVATTPAIVNDTNSNLCVESDRGKGFHQENDAVHRGTAGVEATSEEPSGPLKMISGGGGRHKSAYSARCGTRVLDIPEMFARTAVPGTATERHDTHSLSTLATECRVAATSDISTIGGTQPGELKEGAEEPNPTEPDFQRLLAKRRSERRIWNNGPGDDTNSEQVRCAKNKLFLLRLLVVFGLPMKHVARTMHGTTF